MAPKQPVWLNNPNSRKRKRIERMVREEKSNTEIKRELGVGGQRFDQVISEIRGKTEPPEPIIINEPDVPEPVITEQPKRFPLSHYVRFGADLSQLVGNGIGFADIAMVSTLGQFLDLVKRGVARLREHDDGSSLAGVFDDLPSHAKWVCGGQLISDAVSDDLESVAENLEGYFVANLNDLIAIVGKDFPLNLVA
jgi:hypothetical protein